MGMLIVALAGLVICGLFTVMAVLVVWAIMQERKPDQHE